MQLRKHLFIIPFIAISFGRYIFIIARNIYTMWIEEFLVVGA